MFEALLYGSESIQVSRLEETSAAVEDIYVACFPWLRERGMVPLTSEAIEAKNNRERIISDIDKAVQDSASAIEGAPDRAQLSKADSRSVDEYESLAVQEKVSSKALKELIRAIRQFRDRLHHRA